MKNQFTLGLVILFTIVSNASLAQTGNYQFRRLDVNDGLSHNQVTCFLKDRKGFLWIGTNNGLNRFDGYTMRTFLNDPDDASSIGNNTIFDLFEAPDGTIGVFTTAGLNLYDPKTEKFSQDLVSFYNFYHIPEGNLFDVITDQDHDVWFIHATSGLIKYDVQQGSTQMFRRSLRDAGSISTDSVSCYASVDEEHGWVIHRNGILEKIRVEGGGYKVVYKNDFLYNLNKGRISDYKLIADSDGDVWIHMQDDNQGLYYFDSVEKTFLHLHQKSQKGRLNSNIVSGLAQSSNKSIWAATDHGGVNIIDKKTFDVQYILNRPEDDRSIAQNSLNTIYCDQQGIIWLGTFKKGVTYYHENLIRFPVYKHNPLATNGLPFGDVNRFAEDENGNLWIGTNGGGLLYFDRKRNTYKQFLHNPEDPNSISSNVIVSLHIDHEKKLWIGTYYGGLNMYDGKKFKRYAYDGKNPEGIADPNVWEIFEDSRKRLWIGTMHGGLSLLNRSTNTFSHYKFGDINSVRSNYIAAITEDKNGNLWFGTAAGLDMLERESGRFSHFQSDKNVKGNLSDNFVFDVKQDSRGRLWVATRNGLNLFDEKTKSFTQFHDKDGLPHNTVLAILEDNQGTIWLSTSNGLSSVIMIEGEEGTRFEFRNYDEADGLQGKQFNENAAFKTRKGELIFGGADGFNIFSPEGLGVNRNPPEVILSSFQLYNKTIEVGEEIDGEVLLPLSITETSEISLPSGQNVFSIEFAGLNFFNPEKNQYQYMLEGFHKQWLSADARSRMVTFTNLNPGGYTFRVRASNNDGFWNNEGATLKINVLPPFWKTRTAFALYFFAIISALLVVRKLIQKRERIKFDREQERKETARMHELDMMKIKFFTNVSHEFRTPLTLILTPLERMLRKAKDPEQQQQYQLIQRNAKRLLNLVNQLLDFRKLEVQELKLTTSEGDIIHFIKETVFSFSDLSEKKHIRLSFESTIDSFETLFDQDKLEKILFNLLSNAFKFTPDHGTVSVHTTLKDTYEGKDLIIAVRDTGIGIENHKLDKIFDRFFQDDLPKSMVNQGSGIGLALTKEFVKIHGGSIEVESQPGLGSCFTITLPIPEVVHQHDLDHLNAVSELHPEDESELSKKPLLLLVEDNEDFRFYLKDNLKSDYRIIEAANGAAGCKSALESLPDLIVSDIMMPEMNGIELCKKIKSDQRVSHTPVILLTARSAEEQKVEGFQCGADDYITKPFNFEILVSRIKNLIVKREKLHKAFRTHLDIKASELQITSLDEQFISKAIKCVEDNISDPDFSVEELSHQLGISRAHFYKKLMSLTGKSPLEFIRLIRLQQAAQLLKKSQLTVAEVAYKVGFNNPKYFARYFRDEYKILPSLFASENKDVP
jgi:signal transduction histidine kinase/ligand-binding sensor domain-containing protein/DNA-binding response OmpR family regulator